jgi:hypothetical protein
MKKGKILVVLSLLLVAAVMASLGTGAIDVFTAKRSVSAKIVDDTDGLIGIKPTSPYASLNNRGSLVIDYSTAYGAGFNPDAKTEIKNLFTITNQSGNKLFVWLEADKDYSTAEHNAFDYRVQEGYEGTLHRAIYKSDYSNSNPLRRVLISDVGRNFKDGKDGENAYMELEPGQSFAVEVDVATLTNYGKSGTELDHTLIIRADRTAPIYKYPDPFPNN